jgi:hypothetical protein
LNGDTSSILSISMEEHAVRRSVGKETMCLKVMWKVVTETAVIWLANYHPKSDQFVCVFYSRNLLSCWLFSRVINWLQQKPTEDSFYRAPSVFLHRCQIKSR